MGAGCSQHWDETLGESNHNCAYVCSSLNQTRWSRVCSILTFSVHALPTNEQSSHCSHIQYLWAIGFTEIWRESSCRSTLSSVGHCLSFACAVEAVLCLSICVLFNRIRRPVDQSSLMEFHSHHDTSKYNLHAHTYWKSRHLYIHRFSKKWKCWYRWRREQAERKINYRFVVVCCVVLCWEGKEYCKTQRKTTIEETRRNVKTQLKFMLGRNSRLRQWQNGNGNERGERTNDGVYKQQPILFSSSVSVWMCEWKWLMSGNAQAYYVYKINIQTHTLTCSITKCFRCTNTKTLELFQNR